MVRKREMEKSKRFSLVMEESVIKELEEISDNSGISMSKLVRISVNALIKLIKKPYLNEYDAKVLKDVLEKQYDILARDKIITTKGRREESIDRMLYLLYRNFVIEVLEDSVIDPSDTSLLYYQRIEGRDVALKSFVAPKEIYDGFDIEDILILKEIISDRKRKDKP